MNKNNRRHLKSLYINRDIQNKVIMMNLIYMCIIAILIMGVMLTHSADSLLSKEAKTGAGFTISLSTKLYFLVGISFLLAIFSQLWLTHKICGALINFSNIFDKVTKGDMSTKVVLRESDLLHKEAHEFNIMLENLSNLLSELKKDNQTLCDILKDASPDKMTTQNLDEIRAKLKAQSDCLSKWMLPGNQ